MSKWRESEIHTWGKMRWLLDDEERQKMGLAIALMEIAPFAKCGQHKHDNAHETVQFSKGAVDILFETQQTASLQEGDHYVVPMGCVHEIVNSSEETAHLTITYSEPARNYIPVVNEQ